MHMHWINTVALLLKTRLILKSFILVFEENVRLFSMAAMQLNLKDLEIDKGAVKPIADTNRSAK